MKATHSLKHVSSPTLYTFVVDVAKGSLFTVMDRCVGRYLYGAMEGLSIFVIREGIWEVRGSSEHEDLTFTSVYTIQTTLHV